MQQKKRLPGKESFDNLIDHLYDFIEFEKGSIEDVIRVDVKAAVEQGSKQGHCHIHATIAIEHNAFIKFKVGPMMKYLDDANGYKVYHHTKPFWRSSLDYYVQKTLSSTN